MGLKGFIDARSTSAVVVMTSFQGFERSAVDERS